MIGKMRYFFILTELETINFFSLIVWNHDLPCMECCILIRGEKFILDIILRNKVFLFYIACIYHFIMHNMKTQNA